MNYWATKEALKEMIRVGITEKDIKLDIINHKHGNFLNKLANIVVEPKNDEIVFIRHPLNVGNEDLMEIVFIDECWNKK